MEDTKEFNKDSGQHSEEINNGGGGNGHINLEELDQPNLQHKFGMFLSLLGFGFLIFKIMPLN